VQGWLDHPATNDGWILINHTEGVQQTVKAFYSREATLQNTSGDPLPVSWRPTLAVTYTLATPQPAGDYNGDGVVDAADYVVWRSTLGQTVSTVGSGADGNQNGTIDVGDFDFWRGRFGNVTSGLGNSTTSVPEPAPGLCFLLVGTLAYLQRRR
jgi:hypothetical protein